MGEGKKKSKLYNTNQRENASNNNQIHTIIFYRPIPKQPTKKFLQTLRLENLNAGSAFSQTSSSSMVMQLYSTECTQGLQE